MLLCPSAPWPMLLTLTCWLIDPTAFQALCWLSKYCIFPSCCSCCGSIFLRLVKRPKELKGRWKQNAFSCGKANVYIIDLNAAHCNYAHSSIAKTNPRLQVRLRLWTLESQFSVLSFNLETRLAGSTLFFLLLLACSRLYAPFSILRSSSSSFSLWLSVCLCVRFHFVEKIFNSVPEPSGLLSLLPIVVRTSCLRLGSNNSNNIKSIDFVVK